MNRALILCAALVVAGLAAPSADAASPRTSMFEIHLGSYLPAVDDQFDGASPYADTFADDSPLLVGFHGDRQFWQEFGSLAVGVGARYGSVSGAARLEDGTESSDSTELHLLPLTLSLVYRLDVAAERWNIPLVPYGKAGLNYTLWWIFNGRGEVSNAWGTDGEGHAGSGGTMGWFASGGLQLLLDFFSQDMATEFDTESGVNSSYLFAEYTMSEVNDFGSAESLDLSSEHLSFGMMFEF
jgi:hypothetical protein